MKLAVTPLVLTPFVPFRVLLLALGLLGLRLVGVELVDAEVLVLHLVLLLLGELGDHVVDGLLHAGEGIQLHLVGERGKARVVELRGHGGDHSGGRGTAGRLRLAGGLHKVEGLGEEVMGIIAAEDGERLGAGLHLELARLLALLPLAVGHGALLLRGFQGYCLKDTVKGPKFEETKTQIVLNRKFLKEYQNDS